MSKRRKDPKITPERERELRELRAVEFHARVAAEAAARQARIRARYRMCEADVRHLQAELHASGLLALKAAYQLIEISQKLRSAQTQFEAFDPTCSVFDVDGPSSSLRVAFDRSRDAVLNALAHSDIYPRALKRAAAIEGGSK